MTNVTGLPDPIIKALENNDYSKGGADYSVTGLLKPGYMIYLYKQHYTEIEEDAADRIFSLLGKLMHMLLERADVDAITEQRLYATVDNTVISGQPDIIYESDKLIQDYKFPTIYKLKYLTEYEQQLNMYRYLCYRNRIDIDRLQIVFIFRDWSKMKAHREHDYPPKQVAVIDLPVWPHEQTEQFIKERIQQQKDCVMCTNEDRWGKGDCWAVKKKGNKRALKLCESEEQAIRYAELHKDWKLLTIEYREPEFVRCDHYCTVRQWCKNYGGAG